MSTLQTTTTKQMAWTLAESGTDAYFEKRGTSDEDNLLSDPDEYAHSETLWVSQLGDIDHQRLVVPVSADANNAMLKFFGTPASNPAGYAPPPAPPPPPPNEMFLGIGAIWGVAPLVKSAVTEYVGEWLGRFDVTVGAHGVGSDTTILPTGTDEAIFGRRATVRVDRAMLPGLRTIGARADAAPALVLDALGYSHLIVELRCARPDSWETSRSYTGWGGFDILQPDGLGFLYRFM